MFNIRKYGEDLVEIAKDSEMFFNRCKKPGKKEYLKIASSCAIGFGIMGTIGYVIKLLFIPINNIILS
jgi:protein transport protein SEC61 subunit gamma-like protein